MPLSPSYDSDSEANAIVDPCVDTLHPSLALKTCFELSLLRDIFVFWCEEKSEYNMPEIAYP